MSYVNCGNFKSTYEADAEVFKTKFSKTMVWLFVIALFVVPYALKLIYGEVDEYYLFVMHSIFIAVIGAVGLNILTGFTGLISLGQGAFMGVGAYAGGYVSLHFGVPFYLAIPIAGLVTAVVGMFFGIPSLRLKGLYLSIATLAAQFIIQFFFIRADSITGGTEGLSIDYPKIGEFEIDNDFKFYYLALIICVILTIVAKNIVRGKIGRAFVSIRDNYIACEAMGINLFRYKLTAFAISSFYAGVAGSLLAFYTTIITPESFTIGVSIKYLSMVIIGGLGSILGSIFGAVFMVLLPETLTFASDIIVENFESLSGMVGSMQEAVFGLVIILFLLFEPEGIVRRWKLIKAYWKLWPFSY